MENNLFEKMPINKAYIKLALPVVFSGVLTLVYNMVDMFFVARTGDTNIVAGVTLCGPIFTLLIAMGDIFGLGGASVISRLFGMKRHEDGKRLSVFCLDGCFIFGIIIAALLLLFQNPVLHLLGADAETMSAASSYYFWISLGAPVVILALAPTNLLRTEGHANAAMIGSVAGSIVNMILDPIFIFALGMGSAGAAIATVIGNICADIFYVWFIFNRSEWLSMKLKGFHISLSEVKDILSIGIPSSITNIMQSIGVMLLNNFLLPYGNDKIAAYGIVSKITMIVIMIMVGFSFGGQPLYGYLYGAKLKQRMKDCLKYAYKLVVGISLVISVVLAIFAPFMISIFMNDATMIEAGVPILRAVLLGMPFIGFVMVTTCVFQSCGKPLPALLLSAGRQGIFYAIIIFILSATAGYTGVIHAQPVSDIFTAVVAFILLKKTLLKELA